MIKEFVCNNSRRIPYEYICRQKITNSSGNLFFWMEQIFFEVLSECLAELKLVRQFPLISFCNNLQCRRIVKKSWGTPKIQKILSINVLLLVVFKIWGRSVSSPYPPGLSPRFRRCPFSILYCKFHILRLSKYGSI